MSPVVWLAPLGLVAAGLAARAADPPRPLATHAGELQPIDPYAEELQPIDPYADHRSPAAAGRVGSYHEPPTPSAPLTFGDATYRDLLDLSSMRKDADGRLVAPLDDGRTAVLTLDPDLQDAAEDLLAEAKAPVAAIVVMSIDGRLLALAASSTEQPDLGAAELTTQPWAPSASIFKIVTAAALIDAGVDPAAEVCYHGGVRSVDESNLADDAARDNACGTLADALARSQNAIIAKLTTRHLTAAALRRTAGLFGYDTAPAFALPTAPSTTDIPDGDPLELARAAAGFWHSQLSPIGGAMLANTVASGGMSVAPRIVAAVADAAGAETPVLPAAPRRAIPVTTAATVGKMLIPVTETGTARKGFRDSAGRPFLATKVAGKTGSLSRKSPSFLDYSWFVGYAPADAPEVVVSVLLGNSASYRFKAHTVARLILEDALQE